MVCIRQRLFSPRDHAPVVFGPRARAEARREAEENAATLACMEEGCRDLDAFDVSLARAQRALGALGGRIGVVTDIWQYVRRSHSR